MRVRGFQGLPGGAGRATCGASSVTIWVSWRICERYGFPGNLRAWALVVRMRGACSCVHGAGGARRLAGDMRRAVSVHVGLLVYW